MSELISGKEALIALANGERIEACVTHRLKKDEWHWFDAKSLTVNEIEVMETVGNPDGSNILAIAFRLKPRTITLNNTEVPAPFEPEIGDKYWIIETSSEYSYSYISSFENDSQDKCLIQLGAWRTEEEIKQVIAALRKIFVINNQ